MSNFRIQRKLTEGSAIKMKPNLSNPYRIKSLESRQNSFSRSPKRIDSQQLRRLVKRNNSRLISQQSIFSKTKMEQGIRAYRDKNVSKALQLFKQVRKNGDKSAQLSFYMGSCLFNMGKHQSSIMYLNECISANEKYSPNVYLYIAVNFKQIGNYRQAVRVLEEGLSLFPNFEEGQFYRAKLEMKLGEIKQAIDSFNRCLQINSSNQLATIFLGDCLKLQGNTAKALQKYRKIQVSGKKYNWLAGIKAANILIEKQNYEQAFQQLIKIVSKGEQSCEINYLLGVSCWGINRKQESVMYLQSCLSISKNMGLAVKALKALIISSVEEANFFEAEHHISRITSLGLQPQSFTEWHLFIEGVNDSIKHKNQEALFKLQKALQILHQKQKSFSSNQRQCRIFKKSIYPYLGYALNCNHRLVESIKMYSKAIQLNPNKNSFRYTQLVAEGIQLHEKKLYVQAIRKFTQAFQIQNRPQSYFLVCISLVQQYKSGGLQKEQTFTKIQYYLQKGRTVATNQYPLMLFYNSLVLLFQGKNCIEIIQRAIELCQDPVSQYHFIEALALKQTGKLSKSLEAISKAIQIDPGIQQFYRERSKYYFLAEEYHSAIQDCLKAQDMAPEDEQVPLLLSFYYYLINQYAIAFDYLQNVKAHSGKLGEFQQALDLRLGKYNKLGVIGNLIRSLKEQQPIGIKLIEPIEDYIKSRNQYSQFSVYFYHLILSVSYSRMNNYERALSHLFGCLEQIQTLMDQRESKRTSYEVTWEETESMLDQIKFNIVIVSLLKQNLEEAEHFIKVFVNQTDSRQLKQILIAILKAMNSEEEGDTRLVMDDEQPRISDAFPNIKIPVNRRTITTKLLVSYPVKLKFTIAPQFDPAYLLNFDIDKIEYKIPPPWLNNPTNRVNFTNSVRNFSVLLTQSQASQKRSTSRIQRAFQIREQLKLQEQVQAKLNRLIHN